MVSTYSLNLISPIIIIRAVQNNNLLVVTTITVSAQVFFFSPSIKVKYMSGFSLSFEEHKWLGWKSRWLGN